MQNIPTELLRTFVKAIDSGSFTRAGALVGRSQSAVSLQVRRLEEIVAAQLFQRDAHKLQLTQEGTLLAQFARRILAYTLATVALSLTLWPAAGTGWLYPAVTAVAGGWMIVEAVALLRRANAGLTDAQLSPMRLFHTSNSYLALIALAAALDPLLFG